MKDPVMKSVQMKGYGGSDIIEVNQADSVPDPSSEKVLVTVKAAGVNPIDRKITGRAVNP